MLYLVRLPSTRAGQRVSPGLPQGLADKSTQSTESEPNRHASRSGSTLPCDISVSSFYPAADVDYLRIHGQQRRSLVGGSRVRAMSGRPTDPSDRRRARHRFGRRRKTGHRLVAELRLTFPAPSRFPATVTRTTDLPTTLARRMFLDQDRRSNRMGVYRLQITRRLRRHSKRSAQYTYRLIIRKRCNPTLLWSPGPCT